MTNDKIDRKVTRTFGRFCRKGHANKRAASKVKRQMAKRDIQTRVEG